MNFLDSLSIHYSLLMFYGCQDGACIPEPGQCVGCEVDGEDCIPYGFRIKDAEGIPSYCSLDGAIKMQALDDEECMNNYECQSNLCISGSCVSASLWQTFLQWLQNLFG